MPHKIAEAVIENGKIKYIDKSLPTGEIKVHIIYDEEQREGSIDAPGLVRETAGIYGDIEADKESKKLRAEWTRNARC